MKVKLNVIKTILTLLIVNAAGALLRYFNLDDFIILLGFRFHLILLLPFLIIFSKEHITFIKEKFKTPLYKKNYPFIILIVLSSILLIGLLFIFYDLNLSDPEYFYELGISSIVDYPIYLIWNSPQIIMFLLFLFISSEGIRLKYFYIVFLIPLLLAYKFIPFGKEAVDYLSVIPLFVISISVSLLVIKYQNIYWLTVIIFTFFWGNILLLGSGESELIKILLASRYIKWEGFFLISNTISEYTFLIHCVLFLITILISIPFNRDKYS